MQILPASVQDKVGSAIPCYLVGHGNMFGFIEQLLKMKKIPIYNQIYTNLFLELSAFETNSKQVKAFVLRKFNPEHPKSA